MMESSQAKMGPSEGYIKPSMLSDGSNKQIQVAIGFIDQEDPARISRVGTSKTMISEVIRF